MADQFTQRINIHRVYDKHLNQPAQRTVKQSLDWTGLDSSGMDWRQHRHQNSIGLGWKMSSKNKYNFVALSLQLVRECTWNSHRL